MKRHYFFLVIIILLACKENKSSIIQRTEAQKDCIEHILAMDSSAGKIRNEACKRAPLSAVIDQYILDLGKLNYATCPPSFTQAFQKHIWAWSNVKKVTDNHSSLRGEMHDLFDLIESTQDSTEFKRLVSEIWNTWDAVEKAQK